MSSARLGLIAGNRAFPLLFAQAARREGVEYISAVGFYNITDPGLEKHVDRLEWISVGQFGKLISHFKEEEIKELVMAGQVPPKLVLKDIRLDWKGIQLMGRLKNKNADTVFRAVAEELAKEGLELVDSTRYLKSLMPGPGVPTYRKPSPREMKEVRFSLQMAKGIARLDIGQTVVVKNGAVVAVEAIEGTDEAIRRGAAIGGEGVIVAKVAKPMQDMRFDVPVIGPDTVDVLVEVRASLLAVEAGMTLVLDQEQVIKEANRTRLGIVMEPVPQPEEWEGREIL